MSDTPRTDEELVEMTTGHGPVITKTTWVHSSLCFQLERELNAANERIKRLEEDLMDAKNKHAALVADVALYEDRGDRIKRLEESENRMLNWLTEDCPESVKKQLANAWMKSKEAKP